MTELGDELLPEQRMGERNHTAAWPVRKRRAWAVAGLFLAAGLAVAVYLWAASRFYATGFPLDDAWIHQTYARNLGLYGEWSFLRGQPSAGSTSPLWSALLALGYFLRAPHFAWAFALGGLSLFGLSACGEALFRQHWPEKRSAAPWMGLFLAGEWHFAWAAVSGMETLLVALFILLVLWGTGRARGRGWVWVGLLIGLSVWIRPDGLTLLGPAGLVLLLVEPGWRARLRGLGWLTGGLLLVFVPYLLFNLQVQGSAWPNTFYAKQAEYAVLRERSLLARFLDEIRLPLIGSGLFLLPGFAAFTWHAWQAKKWPVLSAVAWFLGFALLYALRLPVTYQYGRYFMPAMPVYFIVGLAGTAYLAGRLRNSRAGWLLARVWLLSAAAIWLAFFVVGAGRYAQDVAIIETEMVATARWVDENTAPHDLIAAHDIGALGYFAERRLVDLAGLVSPEVIPFMRDEARLAGWLDQQGVDYLVVLEGWYASLPEGKSPVYRSGGVYAPQAGGSNMLVYRWRP